MSMDAGAFGIIRQKMGGSKCQIASPSIHPYFHAILYSWDIKILGEGIME